MSYNPEKYTEKRNRVLGVKRRGMGFKSLVIAVSVLIIGGLGLAGLPHATTYITTRNLDDAIFKLNTEAGWPEDVLAGLRSIHGVTAVETDSHSTRLVVTFDRTHVDLTRLTRVFTAGGLTPTLLNRMGHRQRMTLKQHEEMME